jgi:hypothetical protein
LVTVPVTLNEAEPLLPVTKVNPDVVARVSVPWLTESASESELPPALASATVIALPLALEKTNDPFSLSEPVAGAVIVGGLGALIVRATLVEADKLSPGSVIETPSESEPV